MTLRKLFRFFAYLLTFFLLLCLGLFTFPKEEVSPLSYNKQLITNKLGDTTALKAGWAKRNISPQKEVRFAGYGLVRSPSKNIHDSLYVRAVSFEKGKARAVVIAYDLLLAPALVRQRLKSKLPDLGLSEENLFFTATHTHHSIGGWAEGLAGLFIAGGYDEETTEHIVNQTFEAIKEAQASQQEAQITYGNPNAPEFVSSRLHEDTTLLDSQVRYLYIAQKTGKTACLFSYSAHATCIDGLKEEFSRDYAGKAVDFLEKNAFDFAVFSAGMVASHTPKDYGKHNYEWATLTGEGIAHKIVADSAHWKKAAAGQSRVPTNLALQHIPIQYEGTNLRLNPYIKLRDWAFGALYEDREIYVSVLKINDIVWLGMPCDFSGEFMPEIQASTSKKLIITSFNGAYMGYVTPDKYHHWIHYETMELNWLGKRGNNLAAILKELLTL